MVKPEKMQEGSKDNYLNGLIEEFFIQDPRIIHAAQEHFVGMRMVEVGKWTSFITRIEEANETPR